MCYSGTTTRWRPTFQEMLPHSEMPTTHCWWSRLSPDDLVAQTAFKLSDMSQMVAKDQTTATPL